MKFKDVKVGQLVLMGQSIVSPTLIGERGFRHLFDGKLPAAVVGNMDEQGNVEFYPLPTDLVQVPVNQCVKLMSCCVIE